MIQGFAANDPVHKRRAATIQRISVASLKSVLLVGFVCASVQAQTISHQIDDLLTAWKEKNGAGMAAMLIRDGKVEYRKAFGLADLDAHKPITPKTQFLLASVTKQFTAMAIMILAERGKLQLDDPLAKFCPSSPRTPTPSPSAIC
jgi:CubicO group peptidase (beta-lactamase class C family)